MGTWGYELFEDDVTLDVRGDFEEAIEAGATVVEATELILETHAWEIVDSDDGPLVWLALAALQREHGHLQAWVKAPALAILDSGIGLGRWEDAGPDQLAKRKAVLATFAEQLKTDG
jgi:hypothetical protein